MKKLTLILITALLFCGCKKENDTRRIPDGTTVWLRKSNWPSFQKEGFDVQDSWRVDSLAIPNTPTSQYAMNFYWVHDSGGHRELQMPDDDLVLSKP